MSSGLRGALIALGAVALLTVAVNIVVRLRGYSIPGRTVVRCKCGHVFRTSWIEGGSLKAVRLGPLTRFQYCPVGDHWAIVHPVKDEDLNDVEREISSAAA